MSKGESLDCILSDKNLFFVCLVILNNIANIYRYLKAS